MAPQLFDYLTKREGILPLILSLTSNEFLKEKGGHLFHFLNFVHMDQVT